jgi:hypothetical protein
MLKPDMMALTCNSSMWEAEFETNLDYIERPYLKRKTN